MNNKTQYKTKQRAELTAYLMGKAGEHVTVGDITDHFSQLGRPIGITTVYRQLDKMVDEGIVNKYVVDGSSSACYEYVGEEQHMEGPVSCYHCKCDKCGTLIHLHCGEIEELLKHIEKSHSFIINPKRTVFYGLCDACKTRGEA